MKTCIKCCIYKPSSDFCIDNSQIDKLHLKCKQCKREYETNLRNSLKNGLRKYRKRKIRYESNAENQRFSESNAEKFIFSESEGEETEDENSTNSQRKFELYEQEIIKIDEFIIKSTDVKIIEKCRICDVEKELSELVKDKHRLKGYRNECKKCYNSIKRIKRIKRENIKSIKIPNHPIEIPKGENSIEIPKGENPIEIPKGENSIEIPKEKNPIEIPKGENPIEIPKGENSIEIPKGENSIEIPKEKNSIEIPKGENSIEVSKEKNPIEIPKGENPIEIPKGLKGIIDKVNQTQLDIIYKSIFTKQEIIKDIASNINHKFNLLSKPNEVRFTLGNTVCSALSSSESVKFCGFCGKQRCHGNIFCVFCGNKY